MNEQELKVTCLQLAISSVGGVASSFGFKGEDGKKTHLETAKDFYDWIKGNTNK